MPNAGRTEFELIARIRARVQDQDPNLLIGIGDDAAVFLPTPGRALVTTTDSLLAGRHFQSDWPAAELGHLALAVNLSDLAAMGATSRWALLSLSLPQADPDWLEAFMDGFLALAAVTGTSLIGGNLARGPWNLGVTLIGELAGAACASRQGARGGDRILVTGALGDAAAALRLGDRADRALQQRLRCPQPRLAAGQLLAPQVSSMIDVSDGLLADLAHLLEHGLGAEIDLAALPASPALLAAIADWPTRWTLQLTGGSDYELLVTARPERVAGLRHALAELGLDLTDIGEVREHGRIECRDADGALFTGQGRGWDHFED